jgi:integrase
LGYRKNLGSGRWVVRCADGKGSSWIKNIAIADDAEDADGTRILDFWTATERARELIRGKAADASKPVTVLEALIEYEADLLHRGGLPQHVRQLRRDLPPALLSRPVSLLTMRELRRWRDQQLASDLKPASVTRLSKTFKAALNYAAGQDETIANKSAWTNGLASLPDSHVARVDAVLGDDEVRAIVAACYVYSDRLGLLIEVLATTGCRPSQAARLLVADLETDRVLMPRSAKGRGQKRVERRPLPISVSLAEKLKAVAAERPSGDPLLQRPDGGAWQVSDHGNHFDRALIAAGLPRVVPYALRHTSICRALMRGVPTAVVCDWHDTSELMLRKNYAKYIADYSDAAIRSAQIDLEPSLSPTVVPLTRRRMP